MKNPFLYSILGSSLVFGFEQSPWLDFPYEFHFTTAFAESYYSNISNAIYQESKYKNSFNEHIQFNLDVTTLSSLEAELELEFFQTKATNFTLESVGFEVRKQVSDDIQGDLLSTTIGASFRFVPDHALSDPFVPYQGLLNFEANLVLGKEFDQAFDWTKRGYLFLATGLANQGAPYLKANGVFEMHRMHNLFGVFLNTYFGFGGRSKIDEKSFHGYGKIQHQSVDVGLRYKYLFDIYGSLSAEFSYRVYAFSFTKNQTVLEIRYWFPFSIF